MSITINNKRLSTVTLGSVALALASGTQVAGAQTSSRGLEEIVITATKEIENVQDVPKSVQVVSGAALQEQNITAVGDLQKLVPSIAGEGQTLAMRGVATGASNVNAPNKVGLVVDDVPQPSSTTMANSLYDIERIEVLPGPQGTLAGRNATGGLVNVVTRSPTADWTGFVNLLGTSDDQKQATLFVGGPINDKVLISSSLYYDWFRGLTKNIYLDQWSSTYTWGTRNKVQFLVSDSFTVDLTGFYQDNHKNGDVLVPPFAAVSSNFAWPYDLKRRPFSQLQPGVTPGNDNDEYASPRNGDNDTTDSGGVLRFTYDTPSDFTLTWINSYLEEDFDQDQDFGLGVVPIEDLFQGQVVRPEFNGEVNTARTTRYYTSEFRINSPTEEALRYTAGLFYTNEASHYDFSRYLFTAVNFREFDTESTAGYAHVDYDLTDDWTLRGGIRFEKDKVSYSAINFALPAATKVTSDGIVRSFPAVPGSGSAGDDSATFHNFDIGAQYHLSGDVMLYFTYAEAEQGPIFDSSDSATVAANRSLETLPQESVEAFEAGIKSQLFDHALILNVSLFHSTYQNYQVQTSVIDGNTGLVARKLASVGEVRTQGVELAATALLTDRLKSDLNLSYTDAKILSFPNAPCYINAPVNTSECFTVNAGTPSQFTTQGDLKGESLPSAPKVRATLSFDYTIPLDTWGMEAYIAPLIKYQSSQHTDLLLLPTTYIEDKTFFDLNVGVRNDSWTAEVFARNLFDADQRTYRPQQQIVGTALQNVMDRANNRYYGARLRYNF